MAASISNSSAVLQSWQQERSNSANDPRYTLENQPQLPITKKSKGGKLKWLFLAFVTCAVLASSYAAYTYSPLLSKPKAITSPLPNDDIVALQKRPPTQSYSWKPSVLAASENIPELSLLTAKGALVMNLQDDTVYFAKGIKQKLPMASITKVMTALLTLERASPDETVHISKRAAETGENTMALTAGEQYTVHELLYGLFLHSGNDAAEALAEHVGGTRETFIKLMNQRAWEIGLSNTHFTNPSGLEGDGAMYTTAEALAILTKFTLTKYPWLLDITKTVDHTIPANDQHKVVYLSSEIDLIRTYPGAVGFKTGFTDEAGRCIITIAENNGIQMMAIVLGSENRKIDAIKMLDYAYAKEGITIEHQPFW